MISNQSKILILIPKYQIWEFEGGNYNRNLFKNERRKNQIRLRIENHQSLRMILMKLKLE